MGDVVDLRNDGSSAYLAPAAEGAGLGVVVIHESGLVPHVRDVCDRFAAEGFTALAPELPVPTGDANVSPTSPDVDGAARVLSAALDHLAAHPAVRGSGAGVVGFGAGGGLALWLATLRPGQVRAVLPFDGATPPGRRPDWPGLEAAVEGHFAEGDATAGSEAARALEAELTALGKEVRIFLYPGTSRAFFDDTRPEVYDADAARQAWVRTLEFLRAKLG